MKALFAEAEAEHAAEIASKYNPDYTPNSGKRKKPLVTAYTEEAFMYEHNPQIWIPRNSINRRCGALAVKVGMMPIWDAWGERHACTVLYLDDNVVLKNLTVESDGYNAVQIGAGRRKAKNVPRALLGHYKNCGLNVDFQSNRDDDAVSGDGDEKETENPPYVVREFRISHEEYALPIGSRIHARHFIPGQNVDVSAISKGKGFQGAMKRWNFAGMPASHGVSKTHRSLGSTGQCQDPGKVFKGKKMAGRMGAVRRTTQNLRIVKIDRGRNLLYVKGPVPGQKGNFVEVKDAVKKPLFGTEKVENGSNFPPLPTFEYEENVDGTMQGGFEIMMPQQKTDPFDPPIVEAA